MVYDCTSSIHPYCLVYLQPMPPPANYVEPFFSRFSSTSWHPSTLYRRYPVCCVTPVVRARRTDSRLLRYSSRPCLADGPPPADPESSRLRPFPKFSPPARLPPSEVNYCCLPIDCLHVDDGRIAHGPLLLVLDMFRLPGRFRSASSSSCSLQLVGGRFRHSVLQVVVLI